MIRTILLHRDLLFHGGVPQSFLNLARACDRRRVALSVGSLKQPDPEMSASLGAAGCAVTCLGDSGYLGPARRLRTLLKQEGIEAVVAGSFKSYLTAKLAAAGLAVRVLFWVPGIPLIIDGAARRRVFRWLARRDTLVFISEAVRREHLFPTHRGRERVVYHGLQDPLGEPLLEPYPREERAARLGIPNEAALFCYTAEFVGWKDHGTLLEAFARVVEQVPHAHLILLGGGAGLGAWRAALAGRPIEARVAFLGPRADARRLLGLVDVYVHPSRGEGFGLAVAEAMLAGVPVISSAEGAFPEYIGDGVNGRLFRGGDAAELASVMVQLAKETEQAARLGRAGRTSCLKRFSLRRFAEEMTAVLEADVRGSEGAARAHP
jgi:glycosyltransferase involved in cell wall biosynthesis